MKRKKEKKEKQSVSVKERFSKAKKGCKDGILRIGVNNKVTYLLWAVLILSLAFGVYKNFTAIDVKTVHEREVVQERIVDYEGLKLFSTNFIKSYHTWDNSPAGHTNRLEALKNYTTDENVAYSQAALGQMNTSSVIKGIEIFDIEKVPDTDSDFDVSYRVIADVTTFLESEKETNTSVKTVSECFKIRVHQDDEAYVVIGLPQITSGMAKSDYVPKKEVSDTDVSLDTKNEIDAFLNMFFKVYATADKTTIDYYVENECLKPVGNEGILFSNIVDTIYKKTEKKNIYEIIVNVRFIDKQTSLAFVSSYNLLLQNSGQWHIIEVK